MDASTIFAVATPPGTGSRAVLRLSGPRALAAAARLAGVPERVLSLGGFRGSDVELCAAELRVRAWVECFRAPRSYTREDVVEVHVPGSPAVVAALARALAREDGVRWAGPGEFTLRAFLNGRIDLSQAEAVAQLVAAVDEREAGAARRGLAGELGVEVRRIAGALVELLARVEAAIDFADEDIPEVSRGTVLGELEPVAGSIRRLRGASALRLASHGALRVAIAGPPNAGKSSLFNALLGRRAALVSSFAGTTRDPVRGTTEQLGVRVEWIDLAGTPSLEGLWDPDAAPAAGLGRQLPDDARLRLLRLTELELAHADRVLWVLDGSAAAASALADFERLPARARRLVVQKADLLDAAARAAWRARAPEAELVSARTGEGVAALRERTAREGRAGPAMAPAAAGRMPGESARFLVSAHQETALEAAERALARARAAVEQNLGFEYTAADLREALRAIEELSGKVTPDDILGHIFSRFCIGK